MASRFPRTRWQRLSAGGFLWEFCIWLIAILAASLAWWSRPQAGWFDGVLVLIVVSGFVLRIGKANAARAAALRDTELDELDGVLRLAHAVLLDRRSIEVEGASLRDDCVRIAAFIPDKHSGKERGAWAYQLTDYAGTTHGSGRSLSVRAGAVGRAFRTGKPSIMVLPDGGNLAEFLLDAGFTHEESGSLRQDRRIWAAFPAGSPVEVVIYLDSDDATLLGRREQLASELTTFLEIVASVAADFVQEKERD